MNAYRLAFGERIVQAVAGGMSRTEAACHIPIRPTRRISVDRAGLNASCDIHVNLHSAIVRQDQGAVIGSGAAPALCISLSPRIATEMEGSFEMYSTFLKPALSRSARTHSLLGRQKTVGSYVVPPGPLGIPNGSNRDTG